MTTTAADMAAPSSGRREQIATRFAFFIGGFAVAAWAPLVPFAKARTDLGDGMLGLLLLCLGTGSILAMPLAGALSSRFGCRLVLEASSIIICLTLPILGTASSLPLLAAALFVFGASAGSLDCVINIQAIIVERASGRSMMSGFHGLFSVGGIVGAGGVTLLLMRGATPLIAAVAAAAVVLATIALARGGLLGYGAERDGPAFALPHGIVLVIGVLCFILFLTEGAMLDWSAVFLVSLPGIDPAKRALATPPSPPP